METYASTYGTAASATTAARAQFIKETYWHLAAAVLAFIGLEYLLFQIPGIEQKVSSLLSVKYSWLIVLGLFMGASWIANKWAMSDTSRSMQYAGLGLFVAAEAVIFLPLLLTAKTYAGTGGDNIITQAAVITISLFIGLSFVALTTKKDFSFLGGILKIGGFIALGLIVASILFGFNLGLFFSGFMVLLAAGSILRDTSNMVHHYRTDQYVAASLGLFASVALLFWYVLRILMSLNRD